MLPPPACEALLFKAFWDSEHNKFVFEILCDFSDTSLWLCCLLMFSWYDCWAV